VCSHSCFVFITSYPCLCAHATTFCSLRQPTRHNKTGATKEFMTDNPKNNTPSLNLDLTRTCAFSRYSNLLAIGGHESGMTPFDMQGYGPDHAIVSDIAKCEDPAAGNLSLSESVTIAVFCYCSVLNLSASTSSPPFGVLSNPGCGALKRKEFNPLSRMLGVETLGHKE
jgi:hypothetical protein